MPTAATQHVWRQYLSSEFYNTVLKLYREFYVTKVIQLCICEFKVYIYTLFCSHIFMNNKDLCLELMKYCFPQYFFLLK